MSDPICNKCGQECDVISIDDPCVNDAGANLGYQPSHGESACCRTQYTMPSKLKTTGELHDH
jgi:hypothetical protein